MKSELYELLKKHDKEIDALRESCPHDKKHIKFYLDHSCVGAGSIFPSLHVTCWNCGSKKIIFDLPPAKRMSVKKTLKRQGF